MPTHPNETSIRLTPRTKRWLLSRAHNDEMSSLIARAEHGCEISLIGVQCFVAKRVKDGTLPIDQYRYLQGGETK